MNDTGTAEAVQGEHTPTLLYGRASAPAPTGPLTRAGRDYRTRRMLVVADLVALLGAVAASASVGDQHPLVYFVWALPAVAVWPVLFLVYGLYSSGLRRVSHSTADDIPGLVHAIAFGSGGMWLYLRLTPAGRLTLTQVLVLAVGAFVLEVVTRSLARGFSRRLLGDERVLFVGSGPMTPVLAGQMLRQASGGMEPIGALTRDENAQWPIPIESLGALDDVDPADVLLANRVDRVVVSAEGIEDSSLLALVDLCRVLRVKVSALPSLAAVIGPAATIDQVEGITLIGLNLPSLPRTATIAKRTMDLVGATLLLLVTSPLWVIAAIAIKLDSPGPLLFRQTRIGRRGRPFRLAKFRSMVLDAEAQREALLADSRQEGWLDLERDPRITRVGRILRLTSLDELPQLWNVMRGDMSLVGPRPLVAQEDENVSGWARGRLDLTPGITGMWQVLGRTKIPFEQMVMIDYLYVSNWSLWTDIKLILRTVPVLLSRRGAN